MDKKNIRIIADYIINNQDTSNYGLFTGVPGSCIFLYELSRSLKVKSYEKKANDWLDVLAHNLNVYNFNPSFGQGLAGIGWAIEYLFKRGINIACCDKIVKDIDIMIYRVILGNEKISLDLSTGLTGYLFYIINRLENNVDPKDFLINKELLKIIINKIDEIIPDYFPSITKDIRFDLLATFPLLFYLLTKALKLNIYNEKIINIIKQWILYIETLLPGVQSNKICLAASLMKLNHIINLSEIKRQINVLLYSIDLCVLKEECQLNTFNVNISWMGQAFLLKQASMLFNSDYPNYKDFDIIRKDIISVCKNRYKDAIANAQEEPNSSKRMRTGLLDGLSGIGLMYLLFPESLK